MPWQRRGFEPPSPRAESPDIPDDLSRLCEELLRFNPTERPAGPDVRARIAGSVPERRNAPPVPPAFVGRAAAFGGSRAPSRTASTDGPWSSFCTGNRAWANALAQQFLERLREQSGDLKVLRALLRAGIGAVQGSRWFGRFAEQVLAASAARTGGRAVASGRGSAGACFSGLAARGSSGRRRGAASNRPILTNSGGAPSPRCRGARPHRRSLAADRASG